MSSSFFLTDRPKQESRAKNLKNTPGRFFRPEEPTNFNRRGGGNARGKTRSKSGSFFLTARPTRYEKRDASTNEQSQTSSPFLRRENPKKESNSDDDIRVSSHSKPNKFFLPDRSPKFRLDSSDKDKPKLSASKFMRGESTRSISGIPQSDNIVSVDVVSPSKNESIYDRPVKRKREKEDSGTVKVKKNAFFIADIPPSPFDAIQAGDKLEATITSVTASGLAVEINGLGEKIVGLVSDTLVSDIPGTHWLQSRKADEIITCRVLAKNEKTRSLSLSCKPSIMDESAGLILSSFEESEAGSTVRGWVTQIRAAQIVISFYNNVTGTCNWSRGKIGANEKEFLHGQTVKCEVEKWEKDDATISLSKVEPLFLVDSCCSKNTVHSPVGKLGPYRVTAILDSGLVVESVVDVGSGVECLLPIQHLSDHPSLCEKWLATFRVGEVIERLLRFSNDTPNIVTMKPSLVQWVANGEAVWKTDLLKIGFVVPSIYESEFGEICVRLLGNAKALISTKDAAGGKGGTKCDYVVGQTLIATVSKKLSGNRIRLSQACPAADAQEWSLKFLKSFVDEREEIVCRRIMLRTLQKSVTSPSPPNMLSLGSVVALDTIWEMDKDVHGRLSGAESFLCLKPPANVLDRLLESSSVLAVALELSLDNSNGVLLCIQPDVVKYFDRPTRKENVIATDNMTQCRVLIANSDYILGISRPCPDVSLVYFPAKTHPNQLWKDVKLPEVGKICCVQIKSVTDQYIFGTRVSIQEFKDWENRRRSAATISDVTDANDVSNN